MLSLLRSKPALRLGLAAVVLALELTAALPPTSFAQAQAQPSVPVYRCPGSVDAPDYPVSGEQGPDWAPASHGGGWFYTQEACRWSPITGVGPARRRGYSVVDDDKGNFWTEFRRYGGVDVLGYPVSQPYHYPIGAQDGYWYQAFERGILQYRPETGHADMANVFEQFTEVGLDSTLEAFGIPAPQRLDPVITAEANAATEFENLGRYDTEQRMSWLTEPRFLARYFFDPVGFHSSEPNRLGQASFATQEQAWAFFGLPQGGAQRMVLREKNTGRQLWPLLHSFAAQRFQKAGMQLFLEDLPPQQEYFQFPLVQGDPAGQLFDPTIVPGDGKKGCVALTAVGLLARTIGLDKIIPRDKVQPIPPDNQANPFFTAYVPTTSEGQIMLSFQIDGTGFGPNEPITIRLTDGQSPATKGSNSTGSALPAVTSHLDQTNSDGSFTQVLTARIGTYTVTAVGEKSGKSFSWIVDLAVPTVNTFLNRTTTCQEVGLPLGN
jgi:hypothetical protein